MKRDIEFWKKALRLAETDVAELRSKAAGYDFPIKYALALNFIITGDLKLPSFQHISKKRDVKYSKRAYRKLPLWNRSIPFNARTYAIITTKTNFAILGKIRRKIVRLNTIRIPYIQSQIERLQQISA